MDNDISRPEQGPATHVGAHHGGKTTTVGNKRRVFYVAAVVLVLVAFVGSCWLFGHNTAFNESKNVNTNEYQAVFLSNGQVYFGKLANLNNKYVTITDIYYLQVQQGSDSSKNLQNASNSTNTNAQVSLAKLGSELHGPEDKMYIASDQVLFWENLTNSGKVAQAITAYKQNK